MTILVGYTASPESRAALAEAIRLARITLEDLLVVNAGPGGEHRHEAMVTEDEQVELQRVLDASGLRAEFRQYARGRSTVTEFKDLATEVQPSLVVIGLRRRGTFGRVLMGSVADTLLQELDQPVLCVKESPDRPAGVHGHDPSRDVTAAQEPTALPGPSPTRDGGPDAGPGGRGDGVPEREPSRDGRRGLGRWAAPGRGGRG
ncbi:universal stress protein [Citricoccus sp. SGAir0253]|uniref:universal stress protein n=1 Tax=Citricoccus sp. SGAir0253 TaxID=2567881 RepID=UPI0010CD2FBE|nr:universal stress protein [Citricoccus sp. SGAir0253]QCU77226.1 universal stress protein [Citricoccus sp. SGAir0253]